MSATEADDDPEVWATTAQVVSTVIVFWLAHAYALTLAHRTAGSSGARRMRHQLAQTWTLVGSAGPPLAVMLLAHALGSSARSAIDIGSWVCVLALAACGLLAGRREKRTVRGAILTSLGAAGLGLVMIALKSIIH